MCVFVCFYFFMDVFIYDKIAKIKKEFNILIGSRSRIINLYVSCISNIRWKNNY
jgi:heme O synthase-like polyprenyltransferase